MIMVQNRMTKYSYLLLKKTKSESGSQFLFTNVIEQHLPQSHILYIVSLAKIILTSQMYKIHSINEKEQQLPNNCSLSLTNHAIILNIF